MNTRSLSPMSIEYHRICSEAWSDYAQGRTTQALSGFRTALGIDALSLPARFGLASVLLDFGDLSEASQALASIDVADADRPEVRWLRARVAMARGDARSARPMIESLLDQSQLTAAQRAEALLLLGLALDELGDAHGAFAAARDGKHLLRALHAPQAEGREGEITKLRRIAGWTAETSVDWAPAPADAGRPDAAREHIFLLGFPRSGTTLLEQLLAAHPEVGTLEEAPTLATAYQAFLSDAGACASLERLGDDEAAAWVEHYWAAVRERGVRPEGKVFVDRQPAGTSMLPVIARLFPAAKILFALRDPRDVVLSCFRQAFQMNAMTYAFTDLAEAAACYDACMTLAERARTRFSLAWADVRHEALVEDLDAALPPLLTFLGLDDDPKLRDFARLAGSRAIRTPSALQVRAGINRRGLERWRQYERDIAPILPLLAPWVHRFGYTP